MPKPKSPESAHMVHGKTTPWIILLFILRSVVAKDYVFSAAASDAGACALHLVQRSSTIITKPREQTNIFSWIVTLFQVYGPLHGVAKSRNAANSSSRFAINGSSQTSRNQSFLGAVSHTQLTAYRAKTMWRDAASIMSTRDSASPSPWATHVAPRMSHTILDTIGTTEALLLLLVTVVLAIIASAGAILRLIDFCDTSRSYSTSSARDMCAIHTSSGTASPVQEKAQFAFTSLDDYSQAGQELFRPNSTHGPVLPVLICVYNEEVDDVIFTLHSLLEQQRALQSFQIGGWSLKVMVALDGWYRASSSLQEFVKSVCPAKTHGDWAASLETDDTDPKAVAVNGRLGLKTFLSGLSG
jgi:hypothetical protein